jgi:hypothetical protein
VFCIKPPNQSQQTKHKGANKLERLIVQFQGDAILSDQRSSPLQVTTMVNERLASMPTAKGLKVIGAQWNQVGNCILTFTPNSAAANIEDHMHIICNTVCQGKRVVSNWDVWWSRVAVHRVLTGLNEQGRLLSPDKILQNLSTNECIRKLRIMRKPDWVCKPEEITGMHSSISFSFQDPSGSIVKQLVKQPIFMFGDLCSVKEWKDKPSISQCQCCWVFGHATSGCRHKRVLYRLCGDLHHENEHRANCHHCIVESNTVENPCSHRYCANCKGAHAADDPSCAQRSLHKVPTGQANDGWTTVQRR